MLAPDDATPTPRSGRIFRDSIGAPRLPRRGPARKCSRSTRSSATTRAASPCSSPAPSEMARCFSWGPMAHGAGGSGRGKYHYRFWGQVIRWMAHQRHLAQGERIRLSFSPETPRAGDTVSLLATLFDSAGYPVKATSPAAQSRRPPGSSDRADLVALSLADGAYSRANTRRAPAGSLQVALERFRRTAARNRPQCRALHPRKSRRPRQSRILRDIAALTRRRRRAEPRSSTPFSTIAFSPNRAPSSSEFSFGANGTLRRPCSAFSPLIGPRETLGDDLMETSKTIPIPAAFGLPASLNKQFDSLEHRLWRMDAIVAVSGGISALLISYTLQFASDRFWDTPRWLHFLFAISGLAGFALFAIRYGSRWIWGRRSIRALAVIVQKRYRRLGDRLLGIVELAEPSARPSNFSAELCAGGNCTGGRRGVIVRFRSGRQRASPPALSSCSAYPGDHHSMPPAARPRNTLTGAPKTLVPEQPFG